VEVTHGAVFASHGVASGFPGNFRYLKALVKPVAMLPEPMPWRHTHKKAAAVSRGGFRVCGGQLHKQNSRHCWRLLSGDHRDEEMFIPSLADLAATYSRAS
jgi:hypothetical protein